MEDEAECGEGGELSSCLRAPFSPASAVRGNAKAVILENHWARGQYQPASEPLLFRAYLSGDAGTTVRPSLFPRTTLLRNTLFKSPKLSRGRTALGYLIRIYIQQYVSTVGSCARNPVVRHRNASTNLSACLFGLKPMKTSRYTLYTISLTTIHNS